MLGAYNKMTLQFSRALQRDSNCIQCTVPFKKSPCALFVGWLFFFILLKLRLCFCSKWLCYFTFELVVWHLVAWQNKPCV